MLSGGASGELYDREPAFESCPSASDIAHWFVAEKRHKQNVGGDAWWLSREPHGSCWMLAFVDQDIQEFWLLEVATGDTKDLLWVTNGLDGLWCEWWQHPMTTADHDADWIRDGITWMADQIVVHWESYHPTHSGPLPGPNREQVQCPSCGAWSGEWCDDTCPTCDQARAGFAAEGRGDPFPPCVLGHPRADSDLRTGPTE